LNRNYIQEILIELQSESASLPDSKTQDILKSLFNVIDQLYGENEALREENQHLKDEINCLKGEQGKPQIKANTQPNDHSSEQERNSKETENTGQSTKKKKRQRKSKLAKVIVTENRYAP